MPRVEASEVCSAVGVVEAGTAMVAVMSTWCGLGLGFGLGFGLGLGLRLGQG